MQVDFLEESIITGVVTKGREDGPQWVRSYMVSYSNDEKNWEKIADEEGKPIVKSLLKDNFYNNERF